MKRRVNKLLLAAILVGGLNSGLAITAARAANRGCETQDCTGWCEFGWYMDGWMPRYGLRCGVF